MRGRKRAYANDRRTVAEDGEGGRMRNFERMNSLMGAEPIDEQAVGMLLNHISREIGSSWIESHVEHYIGLYRSMKDWLNSEVEE